MILPAPKSNLISELKLQQQRQHIYWAVGLLLRIFNEESVINPYISGNSKQIQTSKPPRTNWRTKQKQWHELCMFILMENQSSTLKNNLISFSKQQNIQTTENKQTNQKQNKKTNKNQTDKNSDMNCVCLSWWRISHQPLKTTWSVSPNSKQYSKTNQNKPTNKNSDMNCVRPCWWKISQQWGLCINKR